MQSIPRASNTVRFGVFEADLVTGELRKRGRRITLQDQPFQLLILLLQRAGEVVTREELQNALWPGRSFGEFDQGVNTAVKKIRQALGDSAENPRFVETLPRKGYRFIAPVDTLERRSETLPLRQWPRWILLAIGSLAALAAECAGCRGSPLVARRTADPLRFESRRAMGDIRHRCGRRRAAAAD
jgi:DNA-binding winged helix-turn-helix (wHTH) protein